MRARSAEIIHVYCSESVSKMVITGIGLLLPFADSMERLIGALKRGSLAAGDMPMPELGPGHGLVSTNSITKKAYAAMMGALSESRNAAVEETETGVFLGNAFGSLRTMNDLQETITEDRRRSAMPIDFMNSVMNAVAGQLAILGGCAGMNLTLSTGSRASFDALCYARYMLEIGRVRSAVAGGVEEMNDVYAMYIRQNGAVPSDGACMFTVERRADAQSRGARIYAELTGSAAGYKPGFDKTDVKRIMENAAHDAGLELSDIDFVVKSGSDAEADISQPSLDIKQVTGETYGASAAIAVAAAVAVCGEGIMPDGRKLRDETKHVMINSFGFDGFMGSMILNI